MSGAKGAEASGSGSHKAGTSCAECRRSKLKCDREIPCSSCRRRGCPAICPEGTLAATKGNKVLMAHAQRLTDQVKAQAARVSAVESALAELQLQLHPSGEIHPLLKQESSQDVNEVPDPESVYSEGLNEVVDAVGSLSIGVDGQAKYHGATSSSEYFQDLLESEDWTQNTWRLKQPRQLNLPYEIIELVNAFPFGLQEHNYTKLFFTPYLPTRERALELVDLYYRYGAWMYDPIIHSDFMNVVFHPIYGQSGIANIDSIHAHRLAVFFIVMATGILYDPHQGSGGQAEQYHALSRAALSLHPVLHEATCATVQALFMMMRYVFVFDRSTASNELRWLIGGLCARVAQLIGLQRDSAGWELDHDEVQRRRVMFWELYTHEAWTSFVNGRPPALFLRHSDCKFPDDLDILTKSSGEAEAGFHAWKFQYSAECLSESVQHVFSTRNPTYKELLELDKKIRQLPLPAHLQSPVHTNEAGRSWSSDVRKAMQQYCIVCERESNLLYIHRSAFVRAVGDAPNDPLKHPFSQSVLATYRSACRLISSLRGLYALHGPQIEQVWFFWSGILSSCIVIGSLVIGSPGCALSQNAMTELEEGYTFYEEGSKVCRPPSTMAVLQRVKSRAQHAYANFQAGAGAGAGAGTHPPTSAGAQSDTVDELEVLGGRRSVITTRSASNSPASSAEAAAADTYAAYEYAQPYASSAQYYYSDYSHHQSAPPGMVVGGHAHGAVSLDYAHAHAHGNEHMHVHEHARLPQNAVDQGPEVWSNFISSFIGP